MRRQEKYPDTKYFHFHNANPKGKYTSDCVFRAISTAMEQSWEQTMKELTELGVENGTTATATENYAKYLEQKGWKKCKQPRKENNTKYTGEEFCRQIACEDTRYIAHIGGNHIVAIVDRKVLDTWDSSDGCIGNYWIKK